jgi:hypothetical protein
MSAGFRRDPPDRRSGDIQLRLPAQRLLSATVLRLVMLDMTRDRPKSHRTAFPLSSIRTFAYENQISLFVSNDERVLQLSDLHEQRCVRGGARGRVTSDGAIQGAVRAIEYKGKTGRTITVRLQLGWSSR